MSTNENIKIKEKSIDKIIKQRLKLWRVFLKFTKKLTFGRRLFECLY